MNSKSILTRSDYENYLVRVYFDVSPGSGDIQYLEACIRRAYLDFSRTLRGLEAVDPERKMHDRARDSMKQALEELRLKCTGDITMGQFDEWHRATCCTLTSIYKENPDGQFNFTVGQAQKWINMSLKYVFVMAEERVSGFREAYQFCHAPLDNVLLKKLASYDGFPKLESSWSRLKDYGQYFDLQKWIRTRFEPEPPLDVEFKLWMASDDREVSAHFEGEAQ